MKLGEIVKDYRATHKLSMEKFGELAGLSKGYISMLEKGKNPQTNKPISPSFDTIKNIATAMGKEFEELISLLDDNQTISLSKHTPAPQSPSDELTEAITGKVVQLTAPRKENVLSYATEQLEEQQAQEQAALQAQLLSETTVSEKVVPISDYVARKTKPVPGEASAGTGVWAQDADHEHSFRVDDLPDEGDYDTIAKVKGNSMLPIMADGDYLFIKLTSSVDANTIGIFQVDGENYVKKLRYSPDYRFYLESLNPDYDDIYLHEDSDIRTIGEVVEIYREG